MKRIGLIDNLSNITEFREWGFETATAEQILNATGGNTGNVAFVYGTRKLLANPIRRIEWGWPPDEVRRVCDHLVICCANQLGSHVDLGGWADRLAHFGLPVTLVGIGAQSDSLKKFPEVPAGTHKFLNVVVELRASGCECNISTRGDFTTRYLQSLGIPSMPTGCPSALISSDPALGAKIHVIASSRKLIKIAVAAGNPWHKVSAPLEPKLKSIVDNYFGEYVVQHPKIMLQLAAGEAEGINESQLSALVRIYEWSGKISELVGWFRHNASIYVDVPNWIRHLRRYDAVVGPRFHGVMLGVQAGVPGWVISIDSRTSELAHTTGLPQFPLHELLPLTPMEIVSRLTWGPVEAEGFDEARLRCARSFVEFLVANELTPTQHLIDLAAGVSHDH